MSHETRTPEPLPPDIPRDRKLATISLRCQSEVADAAYRAAKRQGLTISEAVRRVLDRIGRGQIAF
jgi:hypothetical protein